MTRAFLILVDGLRPDVAEEELAAGRLPHLAALTAEGGRARAITAFPSTTSVAYLPFLTGCLPGTCNVPSIRWLDRAAYGGKWWAERRAVRSYCGYQAGMLDDDVRPEIRTLFQLVPESMALFSMVTRGLTPERDPAQGARKFWGSVSHYTENHQPGDDRVARGLLQAADEPWRFVFAQFPAVDGHTHATHPRHEKVLRSLRKVDATLGALMDRLARRGELHETLLAIVSDHGASRMHTHLDLADWFRGQGVPTLSHPILWEKAPRAAVMVAGNAAAAVYARPGVRRAERWPLEHLRRPEAFGTSHDVIAALVREPAVAFVAGEDGPGALRLACAAGEARVVRDGDAIAYEPLDGDPLELGGAFRGDEAAWLARTFDAPYPDAAVQLLDQFASPRAGDLVVVAREGYDFRKRYERPEHKSGHGSLIRAHMHTPLWSNRPLPEVPLRTVDVFAALVDWLGVPLPAGVDARPLWLPRTALRERALVAR